MTDDFYKKAFDTAIEELSALTKQHKDLMYEEEILELRMEKLRSGAISLASLANLDFQTIQEDYPDLFEGETDPQIGITEAVRQVLRSSDEMLTPIEIRDLVFKISPSIAGQKNPLASIHSIIRRLTDSNKLAIGVDAAGKTIYGWTDCEDKEERINRWFAGSEEELEELKKKEKKKK